jgi:acyl-CoA reductase-like NAD-dependent aldehyde dehydrogenase
VNQGGRLVCGGGRLEHGQFANGNFVYPAILEVKPDNLAFKEEVFGPLFPITSFKTDQEAIRIANDSQYGLGAAIISRDLERAEDMAKQIHSKG